MSWHPSSAVAHAVYDCGFEYDSERDIIKSRMYPWQRHNGYCWAYDMASAQLSMIIDCEPFYFVYDNRLWLIELWKGQYGLETGAEIGLYYTDLNAANQDDHHSSFLQLADRLRFYRCVDDKDRLIMQFRLFRNREFLFQRGPELHWWLTGFRWGLFTPDTSDLVMELEIKGFPTTEMRDSFARSVMWKFYYPRLSGDKGISFTFHRPRTLQPASRVALTPLMQPINNLLVKEYLTYKRWRGFTNNDPNNITELDGPASKALKAVSNVKAKIRSMPILTKAPYAKSAAVNKMKAVIQRSEAIPHDVVAAYQDLDVFFHKNRKTWHVIHGTKV